MSGRNVEVYKNRLACAVATTVVGDNTTTVIPVDAFVVDFDEEGGKLQHIGVSGASNFYDYAESDSDLETITLSAGLPVGRTLTAGDALYVVGPDGKTRVDEFYSDAAVDDVATDVVSARIPDHLRKDIEEGGGSRDVALRVEAGAEEWHVQEMHGAVIGFTTGDIKPSVKGGASGGGGVEVLFDGVWLLANGAAVSRTTYSALFNLCGETFGAGDGSTTFNIPDLRGRTIFGVTSGSVGFAANEGKAESLRGPGHIHSIPLGGDHNHTISAINHAGDDTASGFSNTGGGLEVVHRINGTHNGSHAHGGNTGNWPDHDHTGSTGDGLASANRMGYLGLNYLIRI